MRTLQERNISNGLSINPDEPMVRIEEPLRMSQDPAVKDKRLMLSVSVMETLTREEIESVLRVYLAWRFFERPDLPRQEQHTFAIKLEGGETVYVSEDAKAVEMRFPVEG